MPVTIDIERHCLSGPACREVSPTLSEADLEQFGARATRAESLEELFGQA